MARAIGLMLTVAGLILAVWFIQMFALPGPPALENFIVAAIAVAMISVGVRYIFKNSKKKKS